MKKILTLKLLLLVFFVAIISCKTENVSDYVTYKEAKALIKKYNLDSTSIKLNTKGKNISNNTQMYGVTYKDFEEELKDLATQKNREDSKINQEFLKFDFKNKPEKERQEFLKKIDKKYGTNYTEPKEDKDFAFGISYLYGVKYYTVKNKRFLADTDTKLVKEELKKLNLTKEQYKIALKMVK